MDRENKIMNKTELIDFIAENAGLTKVAAANALKAFQEGIKKALEEGEPVIIADFGSFTVKHRAAREGRNPSTGEKIKINASKVVGFKAGKALKEAVKESKESA